MPALLTVNPPLWLVTSGNQSTVATMIVEFLIILTVASSLPMLLFIIYHHFFHPVIKGVRKFPGPPFLPLLGNAFDLLHPAQALPNVMKWRTKYGPRLQANVGYVPVVVLTAPEDIKIVLNSSHALNKSSLYFAIKFFFGNGLLTADGSRWHMTRKAMNPAFHYRALEKFHQVQNSVGAELALSLEKRAETGEFFDAGPAIFLHTAKAIISIIFGPSAPEALGYNEEFLSIVHSVSETQNRRIFRPWLRFPWLWKRSKYGKKAQKLHDSWHSRMQQILEARRKSLLSQPPNPMTEQTKDIVEAKDDNDCLLDLLILKQADAKESWSDEDIRYNICTILAAGIDTTAVTTNYLLYCLALYPDHQELVHQELDEILGCDTTTTITYTDLSKLKYLDACVKEVLRIFPSIPLVARHVENDIQLSDGSILPKGCSAIILTYALHHDPAIYSEPEKFKPSRFLANEEAQRHRYAYIPFSAGLRNCIALKSAMLNVKTLAANILRRYSINTNMDYAHVVRRLRLEVTLKCRGGIPLSFSPRTRK